MFDILYNICKLNHISTLTTIEWWLPYPFWGIEVRRNYTKTRKSGSKVFSSGQRWKQKSPKWHVGEAHAAFTHAGLTTRYRTKSLYKSTFVLSRSRDIQFMKRIKCLLKIAVVKFKFENLEIRFHKRQFSFLVVKTVKCKRGVSYKTGEKDPAYEWQVKILSC